MLLPSLRSAVATAAASTAATAADYRSRAATSVRLPTARSLPLRADRS